MISLIALIEKVIAEQRITPLSTESDLRKLDELRNRPKRKGSRTSPQTRATVWNHLRDGLESIGNMPLPDDVVTVVRQFDKQRNGGGTFIDEACYLVDAFVDYLGPITEVSAFTTQMGHRDYLPPDVEDNSVAILRFANGALGVIDAKWGQIGPPPVRP